MVDGRQTSGYATTSASSAARGGMRKSNSKIIPTVADTYRRRICGPTGAFATGDLAVRVTTDPRGAGDAEFVSRRDGTSGDRPERGSGVG